MLAAVLIIINTTLEKQMFCSRRKSLVSQCVEGAGKVGT